MYENVLSKIKKNIKKKYEAQKQISGKIRKLDQKVAQASKRSLQYFFLKNP